MKIIDELQIKLLRRKLKKANRLIEALQKENQILKRRQDELLGLVYEGLEDK